MSPKRLGNGELQRSFLHFAVLKTDGKDDYGVAQRLICIFQEKKKVFTCTWLVSVKRKKYL